MDPRPADAASRQGRPVKPRPWYLSFALFAMWLYGMTTAASGCSNVSYLRGSHELPDTVARMLEEARRAPANDESASAARVRHPLVRASLVREEARLEATAALHRRAFPLALAQVMLGLLLLAASMGLFAGRPRVRPLALQALAAHAALVVAAYVALAPVRDAMASAVAEELVPAKAPTADAAADDRTQELAARRAEMAAADLQIVLAQLGLFALAALALTRPAAKAHFAVRQAALDDAGDDDRDTTP